MGQRTPDTTSTKKDFIPGPGQYETIQYLDSKIKADPKFSFGTG